MPIDISEFTFNRMVYARRGITAKDLSDVESDVIIIKKGDIGFVVHENRHKSPFTNEEQVSVCFNGSDPYWVDPSWISLDTPFLAEPRDIAKLTAHIRQIEEQIKSFDETNRIQELRKEVNTLLEHISDIEYERNIYLDAFEKMGLDAIDAQRIADGNICPTCFESFSNHNDDGSCVTEEDGLVYDDNGKLWKDLYIGTLWEHYEDAVKINEFEDGQDEWDWQDIEDVTESELERRGISAKEIKKFRKEIVSEGGYEDEDSDDDDKRIEGDEWDVRNGLADHANMPKLSNAEDDQNLIELDPNEIY